MAVVLLLAGGAALTACQSGKLGAASADVVFVGEHIITMDPDNARATGADFVVLGENPLLADPGTLKDIPVIETIARGQTVFSAIQ